MSSHSRFVSETKFPLLRQTTNSRVDKSENPERMALASGTEARRPSSRSRGAQSELEVRPCDASHQTKEMSGPMESADHDDICTAESVSDDGRIFRIIFLAVAMNGQDERGYDPHGGEQRSRGLRS